MTLKIKQSHPPHAGQEEKSLNIFIVSYSFLPNVIPRMQPLSFSRFYTFLEPHLHPSTHTHPYLWYQVSVLPLNFSLPIISWASTMSGRDFFFVLSDETWTVFLFCIFSPYAHQLLLKATCWTMRLFAAAPMPWSWLYHKEENNSITLVDFCFICYQNHIWTFHLWLD